MGVIRVGIGRVMMMIVIMMVVVIMVMSVVVVMMMMVVVIHIQPADTGAERIAKLAIRDV